MYRTGQCERRAQGALRARGFAYRVVFFTEPVTPTDGSQQKTKWKGSKRKRGDKLNGSLAGSVFSISFQHLLSSPLSPQSVKHHEYAVRRHASGAPDPERLSDQHQINFIFLFRPIHSRLVGTKSCSGFDRRRSPYISQVY